MLTQALTFLLDVVFSIVTYAFLLRFAMQWMRAPFRNPVGQAVVALTDWAVKPLRRVIPGVRGIDWTTLILAWLSEFLWLVAKALVAGAGARGFGLLALLAVVELVKAMVWLLIIVVIVQAVLSWVAPDGPIAGLLNALTYRFLAPVRRVLPPLGGVLDLSPLVVLVLAQLVLIIPVQWLENLVLSLAR